MSTFFIEKKAVPTDEAVNSIRICRPDSFVDDLGGLTEPQINFINAQKFLAEAGQTLILPAEDGKISTILFGAGKSEYSYTNSPILIGSLASILKSGYYEIVSKPDTWTEELIAIFWGLGVYKFDKYIKDQPVPPVLICSNEAVTQESTNIVTALHRGRSLINTPPNDMGPVALQQSAQDVADRFGATLNSIVGDELLQHNYPMIHAVGRAAAEPPRLVELKWGNQDNPKLTLVGKGITFDSGGLDIKSAAGMRIMKKDMGGAAHVLALGEMIMAANLPINLTMYLAIAENAISANAFRPSDVLSSREGLSIEVDNTDAEGRLVLGDALTKAAEANPDLIIDFATLTGAARVALGPTLPPFFSNRDEPVSNLLQSGTDQVDPFWHMPLWKPYLSLLSSPIADMKNAGGSFAGAVTAALFLQKFVGDTPWMHFDVYGWNPTNSPSKPKGGEIMSVRAIYH
ncbi:MAG: leucyl aminopeptidase family protein, partial [Acidimicrobiales bacterium]